jgi:hypothetical protein
MTQTAGDPAHQGLSEQASAKVQDAASAAQEKASELRQQGSMRMRDQLDQRSTQTGTQVRAMAHALRHSGSELSNQGNADAARVTGQAADHIERLGSYLESKSGDELMRDVEAFARKRPWMLAALGMLAGVATARFMKASSERRFGDYRRTSQQQWQSNQPPADARVRTYGEGEGTSGRNAEPASSGSGVRAALSDDPLTRDPYAGAR